MVLLDIIFPKKCVGCKKKREYICSNCFASISFATESICTVCNRPSLDGKTHPICTGKYTLDGTFSAVKYKGVVRKLVYQLKYAPYLTDLLPVLTELCYEALIQNELFVELIKKKPILVPIPLSGKRLRKRGYNQAELLAKALGKRFTLPVTTLLRRTKETKPQYGLKREERMENMKGAFDINVKRKSQSAKVALLIDDVLTTGSTMQEGAKVLKKNGVTEVWGLALAKD